MMGETLEFGVAVPWATKDFSNDMLTSSANQLVVAACVSVSASSIIKLIDDLDLL